MSTYAIGDIHGCYKTLKHLLEIVCYDAGKDRLWLVGDLVNRGPRSLKVLRWAMGLGENATIVLGNHDLHLLGRAYGARKRKRRDTFDDVLDANDRQDLLDWLRARPLVHVEGDHLLVHAGVHPSWSLEELLEQAAAVETALQAPDPGEFLRSARSKIPDRWDSVRGTRRETVYSARVLTGMRIGTPTGKVLFSFDNVPDEAPPGYYPWFRIPGRRLEDKTVIFGHWAALGLQLGEHAVALDSGCFWGGQLAAYRLEDRAVFMAPMRD
jgi:bis(5'-nucleosyl)-tetraphosphatase (symmetrical)